MKIQTNLQKKTKSRAVANIFAEKQIKNKFSKGETNDLENSKSLELINNYNSENTIVQKKDNPDEEEEKLLQGKFNGSINHFNIQEATFQRKEKPEEEELLQGKFNKIISENQNNISPFQLKENQQTTEKTNLPENLKNGIENLSGVDMSDVKVHYNSDKPAQLQAHAYTQGTNIHVSSGQEKHLAHEAWHVVQQKQGRVKPTLMMKGKVKVNDDIKLETEADIMGSKALKSENVDTQYNKINNKSYSNNGVTAQLSWNNENDKDAISHFKKHGSEFGFSTVLEYHNAVVAFTSDASNLTKTGKNGKTYFYNDASGIFAAKDSSGKYATMFKPQPSVHGYKTNMDYFNAQ